MHDTYSPKHKKYKCSVEGCVKSAKVYNAKWNFEGHVKSFHPDQNRADVLRASELLPWIAQPNLYVAHTPVQHQAMPSPAGAAVSFGSEGQFEPVASQNPPRSRSNNYSERPAANATSRHHHPLSPDLNMVNGLKYPSLSGGCLFPRGNSHASASSQPRGAARRLVALDSILPQQAVYRSQTEIELLSLPTSTVRAVRRPRHPNSRMLNQSTKLAVKLTRTAPFSHDAVQTGHILAVFLRERSSCPALALMLLLAQST